MWHAGNHAWGMGWGWIILIILFIAVIVIIINITTRNRRYRGENKKAIDILKERYARGEIDKEEYDARKGDLEKR